MASTTAANNGQAAARDLFSVCFNRRLPGGSCTFDPAVGRQVSGRGICRAKSSCGTKARSRGRPTDARGLPQTVSMRTRDGVRLDADVYRPAGNGPFPVLLMRQPYGRQIASTICYAHPSWYAESGLHRCHSGRARPRHFRRRFRLFADDITDGKDAIAWAASLPGASGAVGMYGFSYQGTNQLLAAPSAPPSLKALAPAMIGWDIANDWAYENDAFCLAAGLGWATQMGAETARLAADDEAFDAFFRASRALPVSFADCSTAGLHGAVWPAHALPRLARQSAGQRLLARYLARFPRTSGAGADAVGRRLVRFASGGNDQPPSNILRRKRRQRPASRLARGRIFLGPATSAAMILARRR